MIKSIHPFPARMGPDLAVARLKRIQRPSVVLDPMSGSGTVLRHAAEFGNQDIVRDVDPLAILMSRVWTTPVDCDEVAHLGGEVVKAARETAPSTPLPWIDDDQETTEFVHYWFAVRQRSALRRIASALSVQSSRRYGPKKAAALDLLRLALSRIIVTKDSGASLARDTSHSRPHKVAEESNYDVFTGFERSVTQLRDRLTAEKPPGGVNIALGDARSMQDIANASVDVVLSSPPYLNAIDYMRGHRLALVWLGHRLSDLRTIRSASIGTERGPDRPHASGTFDAILDSLGRIGQLPAGEQGMIARYAEDTYRLMSELARVLKPDGRVVLVVGNSRIRKVFVSNADGFAAAGRMVGLRVSHRTERNLPTRKRYLPMPTRKGDPLGERMRTETVLSFKRA